MLRKNVLYARCTLARVVVVGMLLGATSVPSELLADDTLFEQRIRPVLVEKCLPCHGSEKQESNLRLDSREALLRGGDRGAAFDPEQPAKSRLLDALRYATEELKMPPAGKLDGAVIDDFARWLALGAPWPANQATLKPLDRSGASHWSFQPVHRPELPAVSASDWVATPVDYFILARLEAAGLRPSAPADRVTLVRRLYFDLVGLPPSPEEVEAFVSDPAPDAYARLVDRLLASPRYGERWGRYWLDVVRYADTKGYVFFEDGRYPWAYTYRDYVIRSFNADLPYDRFLVEQIAGDRCPAPRPGSLAALGMLTVGGHFMNNTHDIIDDRMDVVMRGVLGLTFTCARCHDHKYDPISQEDYYALYGIFRSCYEPTVPPLVEPAPDTDAYRSFAAEMEARERKLVDFVTAKHHELVETSRTRIADYLTAAFQLRHQPPTDDFMLITDKGDLNPAMILRWHSYLHDARRLHDNIWAPWRALTALDDAEWSARADEVLAPFRRSDNPAGLLPPIHQALMSLTHVEQIRDVASVYEQVLRDVQRRWQTQCDEAAAQGMAAPTSMPDPIDEQLRAVLYGADAPPDAPLSLDWGFLSLFPDRATQDEYKKLLKQVEEWAFGDGAPARAMVLFDSDRAFEPRIFRRGNPHQPGAPVARRLPDLFQTIRKPILEGSGRWELAQAIIDPRNPLTARVMVNRLWQHHFGKGLVATPGDFGLRGEAPSHPELLDWLAAEFLRGVPDASDRAPSSPSPWSIKRLHRTILLSSTYQQSSAPRDDGAMRDPENRLLWRMPPRRLDFEAMRDALLSVSQSLDYRLGGKAVDMWADELVPRRTIYGLIDRLNLPPLLATFDFPNPAASSPMRSETTVSPQALYFMNHPLLPEIARRVRHRPDVQSAPDFHSRIDRLARILYGRPATDEDLEAAKEFLGEQPTEAAWIQYVHGILMTNEFLFVR